jgi:hypothetical protein
MDTLKQIRRVGWLSLGSGLSMLAAPARMARTYGMPERPLLMRALGVRDIAIGAGIVAGRTRWIRYRVAADVLDLTLMAVKVVTGPRRPIGKLLIGLSATWVVFELARKAGALAA